MKKIAILILGIVLTSSITNAQSVKDALVPADVKATLFSKYPKIVVDKIDTVEIKWTKQKTTYKAQFHKDNEDHWVTIDNKGNWLQTRDQIEVTALPKTVTTYIKENYQGQKPSAAFKTEYTSGKIVYEVKIGSSSLGFDSEGGYIKPSPKKKKASK